jgi:hypothetical protein
MTERFLIVGWALFWPAGFFTSFPAWWAWAGLSYFALTSLLITSAFLFSPMEEAPSRLEENPRTRKAGL